MRYETLVGDLSDFTQHYLAAGLQLADEALGDDCDRDNLTPVSQAHVAAECALFLAQAYRLNLLTPDESDFQRAGSDFFLTRNGHGAGFFDRPEVYGEAEAAGLTTLAGLFGPADFELGTGGQVHHYPPAGYCLLRAVYPAAAPHDEPLV